MPAHTALHPDGDRLDARPSSANSQQSPRSPRLRSARGRKDVGIIGQASFASSVVNLLNTIVGAGVLAMPFALSRMGITLGTFTILWAGVTAGFGLYLQTQCARYLDRGTSSFFALSQITYPSAAIVFDAAIALKCFGVGVGYLIVIGDLMPGVVEGLSPGGGGVGFLTDRRFWITGFMLIVIPLSFLRRLDSLKYTSVIALISIGYLVILVIAHFVKGDTLQERGVVKVVQWESAVAALSSFPVLVFAYTCHQNMFSILNEIGNNSHFRTTAVVFTSIGAAATLYILVAITGYLSFGDNVGGNIVAQYPPSTSATIGKAAIVILVMFSYPLQVHPCRASIDAVLKWRPHQRSSSPSRSPSGQYHGGRATAKSRADAMGETRFAAITTLVIVLSYTAAMTVTSLERVLAYVGSTGSTSISFILPGLFYYKISSPDSIHHQKLMKEDDDEEEESGEENEGLLSGGVLRSGPWRRKVLRRLSLALAIYGFVVMFVCLATNIFFSVVH